MIVEDDRGEFELAGLNLGLVDMPERAALVGGLLEVEFSSARGRPPFVRLTLDDQTANP